MPFLSHFQFGSPELKTGSFQVCARLHRLLTHLPSAGVDWRHPSGSVARFAEYHRQNTGISIEGRESPT